MFSYYLFLCPLNKEFSSVTEQQSACVCETHLKAWGRMGAEGAAAPPTQPASFGLCNSGLADLEEEEDEAMSVSFPENGSVISLTVNHKHIF